MVDLCQYLLIYFQKKKEKKVDTSSIIHTEIFKHKTVCYNNCNLYFEVQNS